MIVSTNWGVLTAHYMQHKVVAAALTEFGVDHFIPLIEKLMVVRGRHVRELRPLLGEYIPVAISAAWGALLSIEGVSGILLDDRGFPAQVWPREMEHLRAICDGDVYRSAKAVTGGFNYGQRVSPKTGPFAYHVGRYDGKARKQRDAALFVLFGREQRVTFKTGELSAV